MSLPPSRAPSSLCETDVHALLEKSSRKQLVPNAGLHNQVIMGKTPKTNLKKSPRLRATVHSLVGPKKVLDKGCFRFLWLPSAYLHYMKKTVSSLDCKPSRAGTPEDHFVILQLGDMTLLDKNPLLKTNKQKTKKKTTIFFTLET